MSVSSTAPLDAAALAAAVRQLALQAHEVLNDPNSDPDEARALSDRAADLRRHLRGRMSGSVARWLDRLESRLTADSLVSVD